MVTPPISDLASPYKYIYIFDGNNKAALFCQITMFKKKRILMCHTVVQHQRANLSQLFVITDCFEGHLWGQSAQFCVLTLAMLKI